MSDAATWEKLVGEDLDLGHGTSTVTNPAGGSLSGSKVGLHTFYGGDWYLCAHDFSGSDAGAKIAAAISAAPSTGGVIDCRGMAGTLSAASTLTISKAVKLLFGQCTFSFSGSPGINITSAGVKLEGCGEGITDLRPGANIELITDAAGTTTICDMSITGVSGSYASATGIHVTAGHSQNFQRLRMTDWGGVPVTVDADYGHFMNIVDSLVQPASSATNAIALGTDTLPAHRHFSNVDTGGAPIDIGNAETTLITNCSMSNIVMNTSSKKLIMLGCRLVSASADTTIKGLNHVIIGNCIAGPIVLHSGVTSSTIGPNVTTSAMTNNASSTTSNVVIDQNSPMYFGYQIKSLIATGTSPFSVLSTTPVTNLHCSPTAYNQSGTQEVGYHLVGSSDALSGGTKTITLSGSAAYFSSSSYFVICQNKSSANPLYVTKSSGSQFVVTGTGSDNFDYLCFGG